MAKVQFCSKMHFEGLAKDGFEIFDPKHYVNGNSMQLNDLFNIQLGQSFDISCISYRHKELT